VSGTDQTRENRLLFEHLAIKELQAIHREAASYSFIRRASLLVERGLHGTQPAGRNPHGGRRQPKAAGHDTHGVAVKG